MDTSEQDVERKFAEFSASSSDLCLAFPAIRVMLHYLKQDSSETLVGLMEKMRQLCRLLSNSATANASVTSGCEMFLRYITLASIERPSVRESRLVMTERAEEFLENHLGARATMCRHVEPFIIDNTTVLTHSRSRSVRDALIMARNNGKKFHVIITESRPDCSGRVLFRELEAAGVSCSLTLDAAMAVVMETVDCVLVGAEAVVENGGVLNKVGTCAVALCASSYKKPVYVLAESVKFTRLYPLNQKEVPDRFKRGSAGDDGVDAPIVDYTPPRFLRLLFTDVGVLTPAAVSDQLLQLYI